MSTIFVILTLISIINTTSERLKARNFFIYRYFSFYEQLEILCLVKHEKSFITSGPEFGLEPSSTSIICEYEQLRLWPWLLPDLMGTKISCASSNVEGMHAIYHQKKDLTCHIIHMEFNYLNEVF